LAATSLDSACQQIEQLVNLLFIRQAAQLIAGMQQQSFTFVSLAGPL